MNLYLIEQHVNDNYDTFDSAVVVAESEEAARVMPPWDPADPLGTIESEWAKPEFVSVMLIGTALDGAEPGVVCASFNAG